MDQQIVLVKIALNAWQIQADRTTKFINESSLDPGHIIAGHGRSGRLYQAAECVGITAKGPNWRRLPGSIR